MDGGRDTSYVRTMVLLYSDVPNLIAGILMGANFITKQLDGCLWRRDLLLKILSWKSSTFPLKLKRFLEKAIFINDNFWKAKDLMRLVYLISDSRLWCNDILFMNLALKLSIVQDDVL